MMTAANSTVKNIIYFITRLIYQIIDSSKSFEQKYNKK